MVNKKPKQPTLVATNTDNVAKYDDCKQKGNDAVCKAPAKLDRSDLKTKKVKTKKKFSFNSNSIKINTKKSDNDTNGLRPKKIVKRVSGGWPLLPCRRKLRSKRSSVDITVLQVPRYDQYEKRNTMMWIKKAALLSRGYEDDVMKYLLEVEMRPLMSKKNNYLSTHPSVTQRTRAMVIDWVIQVQSYLELSQETLYQCVGLMDRVLEVCCISVHKVQLLAITTLFIISKIEEKRPLESSELLDLTLNSYSLGEMVSMERRILSILNFNLTFADPPTFLHYFLHLTCNYNDKMVSDCAHFLMEIVLVEVWPLETRASLLAAAALFGALRIAHSAMAATALCTIMPPFFSLDDNTIVVTSLRMLEALANRQHSPFQGVEGKYRSKSRYRELSLHPKLQRDHLLVIVDQVRATFISLRDDNIVIRDHHTPVKEGAREDPSRSPENVELYDLCEVRTERGKVRSAEKELKTEELSSSKESLGSVGVCDESDSSGNSPEVLI